jgi:enoyl-[acyl-carrier-protein] reductase (NADH)
LNDLTGKAVLITGGTKGIGLATGLAFAAQGAVVTLTNKWGSADEDEIRAKFEALGASAPCILTADARSEEDTDALLAEIRARHDAIEVLVSGVSFAQVVASFDDYSRRSFVQSMEYSVWPLVDYLQKIKTVFGRLPRYVIALSSHGPDRMIINYDVVAACKSALETIGRYLAYRLGADDVRLNVVRAGYTATESFAATTGTDCAPFIARYDPDQLISPEESAKVVLALASGMMDGVTGQVITVDRGTGFSDNLMGFYNGQVNRAAQRRQA